MRPARSKRWFASAARRGTSAKRILERKDIFLARRDIAEPWICLSGRVAIDDSTVIDEVLALFREQAALWTPMLDKSHPGWMDAVHTVKGAARGVEPSPGRRLRGGEAGRRAWATSATPESGPDGHRLPMPMSGRCGR